MTRIQTIPRSNEQTLTTLSAVELQHRIDATTCVTLGKFKCKSTSPHTDSWLAMTVTITINNPNSATIQAHYQLDDKTNDAGVWKNLQCTLTAGKAMTHLDIATTDDQRVLSLAFRENGEIVYIHTKIPNMVGLLGGQYDPPEVQILNH